MGIKIRLKSPGILRAELKGVSVSLGTTDHNALRNRDAADQHPIAAITGLTEELSAKLGAEDFLTNTEIEELIGGE